MQERFVRVPTILMEGLMRYPLTGTQVRIILWVIRQTYGWNRFRARFSWYRIASDLGADRGGVVRAGKKLRDLGFVFVQERTIAVAGIGADATRRGLADAPPASPERKGNVTDVGPQGTLTGNVAQDDARHRARCRETSFSSRAKDISKDKLKKIQIASSRRVALQGNVKQGVPRGRPSGADTTRAIRKKYEHVSQN
jgi:hypothetical protein